MPYDDQYIGEAQEEEEEEEAPEEEEHFFHGSLYIYIYTPTLQIQWDHLVEDEMVEVTNNGGPRPPLYPPPNKMIAMHPATCPYTNVSCINCCASRR